MNNLKTNLKFGSWARVRNKSFLNYFKRNLACQIQKASFHIYYSYHYSKSGKHVCNNSFQTPSSPAVSVAYIDQQNGTVVLFTYMAKQATKEGMEISYG